MKINLAEFLDNLDSALESAASGRERVELIRQGKPVAALVSIEDLQLLIRLENELDLKAVRKVRREKGKPISLAAVKVRLGM